MKTIDTSSLWHVHAATDAHPEIVGPGGIVMDVYDATNEQAQEIADILNGASRQTAYSVTCREGDTEVTYTAPFADEVMWMVRQDEQRAEAPLDLSDMPGMIPANNPAPRVIKCGQVKFVLDEATEFRAGGRQSGKSHAMLVEMAACLETTSKELEHYRMLANERNGHLANQGEKIKNLQYERQAWEDTAAQYSRDLDWYQVQLDRCGRALGPDVYVSDDGTLADTPLRAKIAELVEKMAAEHADQLKTARSIAWFENAMNRVKLQAPDGIDHAVASPTDEQRAQISEAIKAVKYATGGFVPAGTSAAGIAPLLNSHRLSVSTSTKRGPCAKQTVRATIITPTGIRFVGENDCLNPQATCPRGALGYKTGEGYHLCKEVCQQTGHAEINAILAAGKAARGGLMYIEGHTYACEPCRNAMVDAGILGYRFRAPPAVIGGEA